MARSRTTRIRIGAGEYAAQIFGGIPMSQGEIVRLAALGLPAKAIAAARSEAAEALIAEGNTPENRARLVALFSQSAWRSPASAIPASTRPWKRSAPRCAASARRR